MKALALLSSRAVLGGNITKRARSTCTISAVFEPDFWITCLTHSKKHAPNQARAPRFSLILSVNRSHNHSHLASSNPGGNTGFLLLPNPHGSARGAGAGRPAAFTQQLIY